MFIIIWFNFRLFAIFRWIFEPRIIHKRSRIVRDDTVSRRETVIIIIIIPPNKVGSILIYDTDISSNYHISHVSIAVFFNDCALLKML